MFKHKGEGKVTISLDEYERLVTAYNTLEDNDSHIHFDMGDYGQAVIFGEQEVNKELAQNLEHAQILSDDLEQQFKEKVKAISDKDYEIDILRNLYREKEEEIKSLKSEIKILQTNYDNLEEHSDRRYKLMTSYTRQIGEFRQLPWYKKLFYKFGE